MRQIGTIKNSNDAELFANHLRGQEIACTVDQIAEGFRIWVHDDDLVEKAKSQLPQFLAEPNHPRYRESEERAIIKLREGAARLKAARKQTVNLADRWNRPAVNTVPVTILLIGISVLVAVRTRLVPNVNDEIIGRLLFSNDRTLTPILNGEVWRIISPIFVHFGPMHLLFNMSMTYQFGRQAEPRLGSFKFLSMVLMIAAISNFVQFLFVGPAFGGMSGVVYGLFGYCWIKGHLEPESGLEQPQQLVMSMLVWHVLCVLGIIPNVANWTHYIGLIAGMSAALFGTIFSSKGFRR